MAVADSKSQRQKQHSSVEAEEDDVVVGSGAVFFSFFFFRPVVRRFDWGAGSNSISYLGRLDDDADDMMMMTTVVRNERSVGRRKSTSLMT